MIKKSKNANMYRDSPSSIYIRVRSRTISTTFRQRLSENKPCLAITRMCGKAMPLVLQPYFRDGPPPTFQTKERVYSELADRGEGEESNGKWHKLARVNSPAILQDWKIRALQGEKDEGGGPTALAEKDEQKRTRKIPVCTNNQEYRI